MNENQVVRIDKIKWLISNDSPIPLCPKDDLRMYSIKKTPYGSYERDFRNVGTSLQCLDNHIIALPRTYGDEIRYVTDRMNAKAVKNMKVINLDDEAVPIAESKSKSSNDKYFVISRLMKSKRGFQLVIYAGEKGKSEKTQIFVEPEVKRMDFDRNNLHPDEIFIEVIAKFKDGSKHSITKNNNK